ncbi:hypothetical protein MRX96_013940 [Rhipicephalus microplus]
MASKESPQLRLPLASNKGLGTRSISVNESERRVFDSAVDGRQLANIKQATRRTREVRVDHVEAPTANHYGHHLFLAASSAMTSNFDGLGEPPPPPSLLAEDFREVRACSGHGCETQCREVLGGGEGNVYEEGERLAERSLGGEFHATVCDETAIDYCFDSLSTLRPQLWPRQPLESPSRRPKQAESQKGASTDKARKDNRQKQQQTKAAATEREAANGSYLQAVVSTSHSGASVSFWDVYAWRIERRSLVWMDICWIPLFRSNDKIAR